MMDMRDLECLAVLGDELHFRRAAQRLDVAQPALSKRIRKIELELGVELFARGGHAVVATDAGTELIAHARGVLARWRAMTAAAADLRSGTLGVVRIGAVGSAFYEALPALLGPVRSRFPGLVLHVDEMETPALVDALRFGEVHLGFVRPPVSHGLEVQTVWIEDLVLAVAVDNPLAARDSVRVEELDAETVVFFRRTAGSGYWDRVAGLFARADLEFRPHENAGHVSTILGSVALGAGVSIVPWSARRLAVPGVAYVPIEDSVPLPLAIASSTFAMTTAARLVLDAMPDTPIGPRE
jgi:DNA-binding transcriptional LysR family regulator